MGRPPLKERALPPALDALTSETRLAPPGKYCTRCLCCLAIIGFEGEWLCAACDDGTHAPLPERRPAPPVAAAQKRVDRSSPKVYVRLRHTDKSLDAWWRSLSFERKVQMFEQFQGISVEGHVS